MRTIAKILSVVGRAALVLVFLLALGWSSLALWFQVGGREAGRLAAVAAWVALLLALFWLARRRIGLGASLILLAFAGFGAWWQSIEPRADRDWAPDVARIVTGHVDGSLVTLNDVRDFGWASDTEAEERWETERFDLSQLRETDLVLSYWGIEAIAHTLVSFGFSDGRHVVFSVEIRREEGEQFSSVAGFFKVYELALVASRERDILFLRTNARGEDTYLYPLALPREAMQALFLSYVETGNRLAREPAFYDTLTANCTTVIFDLVRLIEPGIPMDWRILLSGYLPGYLIDRKVVAPDLSEEALRRQSAISAKAKAAAPDADYSEAIRRSP